MLGLSLSPACWTCWSKSSDENTVIPSYTTSYYLKCLPIEFVASTDDARQRKLICNFSTVALLYNLKRPEGNRIPWFGWILLWPCSMFIKFLSPPKIRLGTRRDVATCSRPFHLLSHSQIPQASVVISRSPVYECQIPGGFHTWKDDERWTMSFSCQTCKISRVEAPDQGNPWERFFPNDGHPTSFNLQNCLTLCDVRRLLIYCPFIIVRHCQTDNQSTSTHVQGCAHMYKWQNVS